MPLSPAQDTTNSRRSAPAKPPLALIPAADIPARYADAKADTVAKFLPVYDNLERALANETSDEAYKKGVELIMTELKKIMTGLGVEEFGETGDPFDPNAHNAVMHIENEALGENVIAQVFQKGFRIGDKVIRHAVVQVAN